MHAVHGSIRALDRVQLASRLHDGRTIVSLRSPSQRIRGDRARAIRAASGRQCCRRHVPARRASGGGSRGPGDAIVAGLTIGSWPARLERRTWQGADVWLDAAHNPAGARALASYLSEALGRNPQERALVFGAMKDKDIEGILVAAPSAVRPCGLHDGGVAAGASGVRAGRGGASDVCGPAEHRVDRGSGSGVTCGLPAGLAGRGRGLNLSGRPTAWYSSLILERNATAPEGRAHPDHERARIVCGNHSMLRSTFLFALAFLFVLLGAASSASAQADADISNCKNPHIENLTGIRFPMKNDQGIEEMRMILTGAPDRPVRIDCDDMHLSADQMEVFDGHRSSRPATSCSSRDTNRIASERLEFDTKTRTGTFYNASGTVSMANRVDRSMFGTQEPDAMFRGDEIHKLGPERTRSSTARFTTCVQPTPRWEMVAGSVTLKVDDHALLTNTLLRVKGVPVMYLPAFYYPIQEDDRATGFLMPIYGASTVRGQSISNAFFWAINRSQDATFMHDWFSKTGQAFGGEYRYELGGGNHGNARFNLLNEHAADYQQSDGSVKTRPRRRISRCAAGCRRSSERGCMPARTSTTPRISRSSSAISRTFCRRTTAPGPSAAT